MTDQPSVFVWDASALHHAIKADRADVLLDLADHAGETSRRHVTTAAVAEELSLHNLSLPSRIDVVNVDGLNEIVALATWVNLMSSSRHNRGEATVCAWAEVHQADVIMDDRDASRIARSRQLAVRGTLRVVTDAILAGHITQASASNFVDHLISTGARYPLEPGQLISWARGQGLLPKILWLDSQPSV